MKTILISNAMFDTHWETQLDGRDYIVVKGVPLVEGVLNGRFVSAEEFGDFVKDWDDIPVVMRHPGGEGRGARGHEPDHRPNPGPIYAEIRG